MLAENGDSTSGVFLFPLASDCIYTDLCYKRAQCLYKDLSTKYRHNKKDFSKQFAHIYAIRLSKLRDSVLRRAVKLWGTDVPVRKLVELQDSSGEKCIIIGTLFKHQQLKPSILKEISKELALVPQPLRTQFVSESDEVILEDELQRIRLLGDVAVANLVTGVVCAALGSEDDSGKFLVEALCWPQLDWSAPPPVLADHATPHRYLVLLSGLELADMGPSLFALELFTEWIGGWLGDPEDQQRAAQVVRVLIAGNSVRASRELIGAKVVKSETIENGIDSLSAVDMMDNFLLKLTETVDVELMPGEFDPTNHTLPQQPLHFCLFPKAVKSSRLHGAPNPHSFSLDGRLVVGSAGQPLQDIARYSMVTDPLAALECTLDWAHIAPTAPDTLGCYPFYADDPFILNARPDVYIAGNQPSFQTKLLQHESRNTRLVCVPSFNKTRTCVVVDLGTLDCYPMSFGCNPKNK